MAQSIQHIEHLIPAYVLEALDSEELLQVERHLASCGTCRGAVDEYRAVGDNLLLALAPQAPPARVRAGLIARLAEEKAPARPAPRRSWSLARLAAGLALILLLGSNLALFSEVRSVRQEQARLAEQLARSQDALALLAQPGARVLAVAGEGAQGTLILNTALNTGVLTTWGLPDLPVTQDYQLWLIPAAGDPVGVAVFRPEGGERAFILPFTAAQPFGSFAAVGVTIEPAGGSPAPTGPLVLQTNL